MEDEPTRSPAEEPIIPEMYKSARSYSAADMHVCGSLVSHPQPSSNPPREMLQRQQQPEMQLVFYGDVKTWEEEEEQQLPVCSFARSGGAALLVSCTSLPVCCVVVTNAGRRFHL